MGHGAVCHTVNPRLSDKDIKFIINDAADLILLSDITFAAQLERIVPECPSLRVVVFLTDRLVISCWLVGWLVVGLLFSF